MTVDNFKKALERMKERNNKQEIEATLNNLQRSKDEERFKVFQEVFNPSEKSKKSK